MAMKFRVKCEWVVGGAHCRVDRFPLYRVISFIIILRMCWRGKSSGYRLSELSISCRSVGIRDMKNNPETSYKAARAPFIRPRIEFGMVGIGKYYL